MTIIVYAMTKHQQRKQQQDSFVPLFLPSSSSSSSLNKNHSIPLFNRRLQQKRYPSTAIQKRDSSIPNYGYDFFNELDSFTPPGIFSSDPNNGGGPETNRLDLAAGPLFHHGHHHAPPVLLVSHKNSGFTNWIIPFLLMLSLPFVSGAAFIPLFLKSIVYLLQIGRNLGIFFPLIPPVMNATHHNHIG
ncbi:hypothetical protein HUG17_0274 [Dermatophagoides farinae]|uniref:Uncharacterized protein n=1 Tax=Dermatophagoides farinae TaxID=6954 RepID=A0A9D4SKJ4_DERFA|nr:hypothetical protein HUG17_0274 [Dermatophagoides farinae]